MKIYEKNDSNANPPVLSRICKFCNQRITSDFQFCPYCGKMIGMPAAQSQSAPIIMQKNKPEIVHSAVELRTMDGNPVIDDGTGWVCGRERLLEMAKVVFGDDPAPFLLLPPGDDNRIAALCTMTRFLNDNPQEALITGSLFPCMGKHFVTKEHAIGFGDTYEGHCYDGGTYSEEINHYYTTIQKCSEEEYRYALQLSDALHLHGSRRVVELKQADLPYQSSVYYYIPDVEYSTKGVHYYKNWRGLKGFYKIIEDKWYGGNILV